MRTQPPPGATLKCVITKNYSGLFKDAGREKCTQSVLHQEETEKQTKILYSHIVLHHLWLKEPPFPEIETS